MTDGRRATSATARIVKVLGIFTGVQGIQMLCSVVRVKLVALWIAPRASACLAYSIRRSR